jgi:hypothetical protein
MPEPFDWDILHRPSAMAMVTGLADRAPDRDVLRALGVDLR